MALTSLFAVKSSIDKIQDSADISGQMQSAAEKSKEAEVSDLFSQFDRFGDGFCLSLLRSIFIFLWSLLLVIPGIIASLSYSMAHFIMVENPNMTAREALRASKELMDGYKWDLFCLNLSFIGWILLCILTLGIGYLWLDPYMNAAHAAFYRSIRAGEKALEEG